MGKGVQGSAYCMEYGIKGGGRGGSWSEYPEGRGYGNNSREGSAAYEGANLRLGLVDIRSGADTVWV